MSNRREMPWKTKPRLTDEQVREIRELVGRGFLQREVAERFGISQPTVSKIVNGVRRGVS